MKQLFQTGGEGRVLDFLRRNSEKYKLVASPKFIADLYYVERAQPKAFEGGLPITSIATLASLSAEPESTELEAPVVHIVADPDGEEERVAQLRGLYPTLTFVGLCRDLVPALLARSGHRVLEDLDALPMPTDLLVVFATPRSGSSHLGDIVGQMGLGEAREHLRPTTLELLTSDYSFDRVAAIRNFLRLENNDGWVSTKLITHFARDFIAENGSVEQVFEALQEVRCHVIGLDRKDRAAQAVSGHIASQRGLWHYFEGGKQSKVEDEDIKYSFESIFGRLTGYAQQGAYLRMWRDLTGSFETLWYEDDLDGKPSEEVARTVAGHLDLPSGILEKATFASTGRVRIASDLNVAMIARFKEHWQARFGTPLM